MGTLFNVIQNLWHDILHEYNLLRRFGPDGTVVWACYLMLYRTYGTGMFYAYNLLRMVGPDGTEI